MEHPAGKFKTALLALRLVQVGLQGNSKACCCALALWFGMSPLTLGGLPVDAALFFDGRQAVAAAWMKHCNLQGGSWPPSVTMTCQIQLPTLGVS